MQESSCPMQWLSNPNLRLRKLQMPMIPSFVRCKLTPKLTPEKHLTKSYETMTYHKTMSIDFAKQLRSSSMCSKLNHIESAEIVWFNNFQPFNHGPGRSTLIQSPRILVSLTPWSACDARQAGKFGVSKSRCVGWEYLMLTFDFV